MHCNMKLAKSQQNIPNEWWVYKKRFEKKRPPPFSDEFHNSPILFKWYFPFVSPFGCQPLCKTCCLTSSPSNEPQVQRSTWQRCRLNICSYIGWIDKYCICQSTNITTNIETAVLSKEHILQSRWQIFQGGSEWWEGDWNKGRLLTRLLTLNGAVALLLAATS